MVRTIWKHWVKHSQRLVSILRLVRGLTPLEGVCNAAAPRLFGLWNFLFTEHLNRTIL